MRIVVDLQACQTEVSKDRGVGRYSAALAAAVAAAHRANGDMRICVNAGLDRVDALIDALDPFCDRQRISAYAHPSLDPATALSLAASAGIAETIVRQHWMRLQPDVLHVSHLFEGFAGDAVVPALPAIRGVLRSATLYDLIPLRFPDHYFADAVFKRWYLQRIGMLRACDHLLAISETSRNDAIELLGIAPSRITTIHGGVDERFAPTVVAPDDALAFRRRFGLRQRFVLYTGGDEYRKNLRGALAGFAEVPAAIRRDTQFVVVCALTPPSQADLLAHSRKLGLAPDDIVLTGYVSTEDLLRFYRLCDAFVFPSFYEGLGLPVLEAMKCGAPVLGSNTSGIGEVIGRDDALFDPYRPSALAERLTCVLTDVGLADTLRRHGIERASRYGWQHAASAALAAWQDAREPMAPRAAWIAAASLPRRRLAVFTPLPPSRSGIADYNAAFLPYLAHHFDIDIYLDRESVSDDFLRANFALLPHAQFPARAGDYDAVVYDMGGSEFHAYMLDYLERFPGIVVLHDAYLGGLYGYAEFHLGQPARFGTEMLRAHGPAARRYLAPSAKRDEPVRDAMVNLPGTRSVIEAAIGVMSHSPFNRAVADRHYPEGFATPYRIVPQMVRVPPLRDAAECRARRSALGFGDDAFLVCTFGHVVWTKCGDLLLDAFSRSRFARMSAARLVYVGELAEDTFGDALRDAIAKHPLADRIAVTGYLDEKAYEAHLAIADIAVQLRIKSRGGTPKGVLDCLAHGVPVVVNNDASYTDYPDDAVIKLPAEPSVEALARLFDEIADDPARLREFARRGRDYVVREHAPEQVAARYALAVEEFVQRAGAASLRTAVETIAAAVNRDPASLAPRTANAAAALHASLAQRPFATRRVLIDVSHLTAGDHRTGIQRVVRSIVRSLYLSERAGFAAIAVRLHEGRLVTAHGWLDEEGLLMSVERGAPDHEVAPQWGDCLLMLDSSWSRYAEFERMFDAVRRLHGTVCTVVYDLLPIRLPQHWPAGASAWFEDWLRKAIAASDGIVCISRAVADDLGRFIAANRIACAPRVGYWHLGCDALATSDETPLAADVAVAMQGGGPALLMVGTLEPRKNHALALSAMERLWAEGSDARLCIVGKQGWLVEDLVMRIHRHPELGRRLHYLAQLSDAELAQCYRRAAAVLVPSAGEGFGLPLIEAAHAGTPIIASDLPVFREIAGEHATYFALRDADALAATLRDWLTRNAAGGVARPDPGIALTWEQSADELLDVILENRWYERPACAPRRAPVH